MVAMDVIPLVIASLDDEPLVVAQVRSDDDQWYERLFCEHLRGVSGTACCVQSG